MVLDRIGSFRRHLVEKVCSLGEHSVKECSYRVRYKMKDVGEVSAGKGPNDSFCLYLLWSMKAMNEFRCLQ